MFAAIFFMIGGKVELRVLKHILGAGEAVLEGRGKRFRVCIVVRYRYHMISIKLVHCHRVLYSQKLDRSDNVLRVVE